MKLRSRSSRSREIRRKLRAVAGARRAGAVDPAAGKVSRCVPSPGVFPGEEEIIEPGGALRLDVEVAGQADVHLRVGPKDEIVLPDGGRREARVLRVAVVEIMASTTSIPRPIVAWSRQILG
jgi:hypothetical protein